MKRAIFDLVRVGVALVFIAADWRIAEPGLRYVFPRDHHAHPDFKTEWWYFTGNLHDSTGHQFGYELTFFRQGVRRPNDEQATRSRFAVADIKFAHFTVSDLDGQQFHFDQKISRGSFGEAGFDDGDQLAWIENWTLKLNGDGSFDLAAEMPDAAVRLHLDPRKAPVAHGQDGISPKAIGAGHASHYYSSTRLAAAGELRVGKRTNAVVGESWFDHEWATNQLGPGQVGWNWLCVQFSDNSELMLYQMRLANGAVDPVSNGTLISPDGTATHLASSAFQLTPEQFWTSGKTGARYPISWRARLPEQQLDFTVSTRLANQELVLPPLTYWEGAIEARGTRAGRDLSGTGYLELTGYATPLGGLNR